MTDTARLDEHNEGIHANLGATSGDDKRRIYSAPRVLSTEHLEAAAATCDPPTLPYGKGIPSGCTIQGS